MSVASLVASAAVIGVLLTPAYDVSGADRQASAKASLAWPVQVQSVRRQDVEIRQTVTGRVRWLRESALAFPVAGCLASDAVAPKIGQKVAAGEELARLDLRAPQARLARASARVAELQAEADETRVRYEGAKRLATVLAQSHRLAKSVLERTSRLARSGTTSAASLDQAKADLNTSLSNLIRSQNDRDALQGAIAGLEARIESARADLSLAMIEREQSVLHAPFAGIIAEHDIQAGECVTAMSAIVTLADPNSSEFELDIPLRLLEQMRSHDLLLGEIVEISVPGSTRSLSGRLVRESPRLQAQGVRASIYATADDPGKAVGLKSGQSIRARILKRRLNDVVALPVGALYDGDVVYRVEDQVLRRTAVDVRYRHGEWVYIGAGLQDDEQVMITRLRQAVEGLPVRLVGSPGGS